MWKLSFHTEKNAPNLPILISKKQMWGGFFLTWRPTQMQKLVSDFLSEKVLQTARPFYTGT